MLALTSLDTQETCIESETYGELVEEKDMKEQIIF